MKKVLAFLMAAMFLFIVGCENVDYVTNVETSEVSEETSEDIYEQLESYLPEISLPPVEENETPAEGEEGETETAEVQFTIVTNSLTAFYQDEEKSSIIGTAIEERNAFLKEKYGANIKVIEKSGKKLTDELKAAVNSGTQYCDMLAVSAENNVSLYLAGLLYNMNSLPDFDATSEYFDQRNATALATNSTLYMLADPTALYYEDTYVMFYNRDLVKSKNGKTVEDLVLEGKWTWDKLYEYARAAAGKTYDKKVADLAKDTFGISAYDNEISFPSVMFISSGKKFVTNNYKHKVEVTISPSDAESTASIPKKLYNSTGRYPYEGNTAAEVFENGRIAFFCNTLDYMYKLRDGTTKGDNYGFLPIPKTSAKQDGYYCLADRDARVISVPKTMSKASNSHKQYVSAIISATCAIGGATVREAFINSQIARYLSNNTETLILETICDSAVFDFCYIYGTDIFDVGITTVESLNEYYFVDNGLTGSINRRMSYFTSYSNANFK